MLKKTFLLVFLTMCILFSCESKVKENQSSNPDSTEKYTATAAVAQVADVETNISNDLLSSYTESKEKYADFKGKHDDYWQEYTSVSDTTWERGASSAEDDWDNFVKRQQQDWQNYVEAQNRAWADYVEKEKQDWDKYVAEVESKWGEFQGSTKHEWVDYSGNREAKGYVDFEKGYAVFESVVDNNAADPLQAARQKLDNMIQSMSNKTDFSGQKILPNQIPAGTDLSRMAQNPVRSGTVTGKDGIRRTKYAVTMKLVPDHLQKRAIRYKPLVEKYSDRYNLDFSLVMAVIETESYFNPKAKSWANAFGLMQIVPKFAGVDTWEDIYGSKGIPSGEYLFNPENNIMHGCCYLNLLGKRDWKKIGVGNKKDYIIICSYNCGPGNVRRMVFRKYGPPENHSEQKLFDLLTSYTPEETRNYLKKVTEKREKWKI